MVSQLISNGNAFVCYVGEDSAMRAVSGLNHKMIDGKALFATLWKPKEELVKILNARKQSMLQKQIHNVGAFNPMFTQQMKQGRGRAAVPQVMPQAMPILPPFRSPPAMESKVNKLGFDLLAFSNAPIEGQRRMIGEQLYPVVLKNSNGKIAGKITGMILELDTRTLLSLIQNKQGIANKVREAIKVLKKAWENNQEALSTLPK